MVICRINPG